MREPKVQRLPSPKLRSKQVAGLGIKPESGCRARLALRHALCTCPLRLWGPPPVWAPGPHPTSVSSAPCSCVSDAITPGSPSSRPLLVSAFCFPSSPLSAQLCLYYSFSFSFSLSPGVSLPVSIPLYSSPPDSLTVFPPPSLSLPSSLFLTILPA